MPNATNMKEISRLKSISVLIRRINIPVVVASVLKIFLPIVLIGVYPTKIKCTVFDTTSFSIQSKALHCTHRAIESAGISVQYDQSEVLMILEFFMFLNVYSLCLAYANNPLDTKHFFSFNAKPL